MQSLSFEKRFLLGSNGRTHPEKEGIHVLGGAVAGGACANCRGRTGVIQKSGERGK